MNGIKTVLALKTGDGQAHTEHLNGSRKPAPWWIFVGKEWIKIPLGVFLIDHEDGVVLFDTGQDRAVMTDPDYYPSGLTGAFLSHLFKFDIGPNDTLTRQMEMAGYSPDDVRKAVLSHFHLDHVGGISEIPGAELVTTNEEWQNMLSGHPERHGIFRERIDLPGAKWNRITWQAVNDGSLGPFRQSFDLMGDGSMMVLPTPGHTPGSISMLVRRDGAAPLLMVGDLCYSKEMLLNDRFSATGDRNVLKNTFAMVRGLLEIMPDMVIVPAHDPVAFDYVQQESGMVAVA